MKQIPLAGKALTLLFTAAFLVACSSTDTKDTTDAPDPNAKTQDQIDQDKAIADQRMKDEKEAEMLRMLEQEAMRAGTVFYFEFDSSALTAATQGALDAHIALLKTNERSVRLEGHTDERGTRDYNLALGERRANAVRDYMVVNGIASYRIETVSFGEEQPVAYGSGESNWRQNRRVELK